MLLKNTYFWLSSIILLALVVISIIRVIPPIMAEYSDNQDSLDKANAELDKQKKFLAALSVVREDSETLDELHEQAQLSLPKAADSEILMLQLDGLLTSLNLGSASINVPLQSEDATESANNSVEVTISGNISYDQMTTLLAKLKTFSRWNKVSSFSISKATDKYTSSVSIEAFFQPGLTKEFSGNSRLIAQAEDLFADFVSYATNPDISTEGTFGKPNPFTP